MNAGQRRGPSASPGWAGTMVKYRFSEVTAGTGSIPAAQYGLLIGHQWQVFGPIQSAEARATATEAFWNGRVSMVQQSGAANVSES